MKEYNLTQNGLARATGLSKSAVCRILTGKMCNPTIRTILTIADVLETNVDELLY